MALFDVKVCILWHMDQSITSMIVIMCGDEDSIRQPVSFDLFPMAYYKCRHLGNFSTECKEIRPPMVAQ